MAEESGFQVGRDAALAYVPQHLRALPWSSGFLALPDEQQHVALTELATALAEFQSASTREVSRR